MPERRHLSFTDLNEVMPEAERLLAGYDAAGQWTLGQICNHLTIGFHLMIDGATNLTRSIEPEEARYALIRERFFQAGRFPDGVTAPLAKLVPKAGLDDREEVAALRIALDRYLAAPGPFRPHPRLGSMTKEEWTRFHCLHTAHHLGFAVPRPTG